MSFIRRPTFVALTLCVATAWGQSNKREPHIGYLYPGGGQQGSVVQITAGGQFLTGTTNVYVSGEGVRASVIRYIRPLRNLQKQQRVLLQKRLKEMRDKCLAELSGKSSAAIPVKKKFIKKAADKPGVSPQDSLRRKKENGAKKKNVSRRRKTMFMIQVCVYV